MQRKRITSHCSLPDCDKPVEARGWCKKHYIAWWKQASDRDLETRKMVDPRVRFWAKVNKAGPMPRPDLGPCWVWVGAKSWNGYGQLGVGRKIRYAHVVIYEWERGLIPDGLQLDHLCRTRCCVRVSHLEIVTQAVNRERGVIYRRLMTAEALNLTVSV